MPSRKKNRGKQRKAKQKCEAEAACKEPKAGGLDHQQPLSSEEQKALAEAVKLLPEHLLPGVGNIISESNLASRHHVELTELDGSTQRKLQNFVDQHQGQRKANDIHSSYAEELREIVVRLSDPRSGKLRDDFWGESFHTQLLFFFGQCDKSVPEIVQDCCDADEGIEVPSLWLDILRIMVRNDGCPDDVLLEVAKSLGPLVEGIANVKRELFLTKIVWHMCISRFFELVHGVMTRSRRGFVQMLSHEGLLPFVAQASCWSVSRADDIVTEAGFFQPPDAFHRNVCYRAQKIIGVIIEGNRLGGEGVSLQNSLELIARAPLLSNDPNCLDSTIVGLIGLLGYRHQDAGFLKEIIEPLLFEKGYVDARVIEAVIDIGRRGSARFVTAMMHPILGLFRDFGHIQPSDSRYAAAIRAGLLEFLIGALVHDKCNEHFAADDVYTIANGLYTMAGHSKTTRALRGRKDEILEALGPLRKSQSDRSNAICSVIEDAVDYGTLICCNCLKIFDRNVLRFCQGCMIECFCSAACQAESWDAGHGRLCGYPKWKGINATEHKRCEVLRQNVMMNGCRFVRRNIDKVLLSLKVEKCNAVAVSFAAHPPRIRPLRKTGNQHRVGGLECIFTSPVHYGFAAKVGKGGIVLDKVIPQGVVAQLESQSHHRSNHG